MAIVRELGVLVKVISDSQGIQKAEAGLTKFSQRVQSKFAGITSALGPLTRLLGAAAIGEGIRRSIKAASDLEETMNLVREVFGQASGEVEAFAENVSRVTGRSRADLLRFAGSAQSFLMPMLGSAEAAKGLSIQVSQLAVDIASFNNVSDDEAFTALRSGLTGETEPLKRFGVVMTQAALDQFLLEQGVRKTVRELTEQEKVLLRYQFIMARTQSAQGDATRTANSVSNRWRALTSAVRDFGATVGSFAIGPGADLLGMLSKAIRVAERWVAANGQFIAQNLGRAFDEIGRAVRLVIDGIAWLTKDLSGMEMGALAVAGVIAAAFLGIPAAILAVKAAIVAFIGFAIADFQAFRDGVENTVIGRIVDAFKSAFAVITDAMNAFAQWVDSTFEAIGNSISAFLRDPLEAAAKAIDALGSALGAVGEFFSPVGDMLSGAADAVRKEFAGAFGGEVQIPGPWSSGPAAFGPWAIPDMVTATTPATVAPSAQAIARSATSTAQTVSNSGNTDISVTINAPSGDAKAIASEVGRVTRREVGRSREYRDALSAFSVANP